MQGLVGIGIALLSGIEILQAQEMERKYVEKDKIEEFRPQLKYDFEKYLLMGSLLGKGYVSDPRLRENLEWANGVRYDYLRVPVNNLTRKRLIPPIGESFIPCELTTTINGSREEIQERGRLPRVGWNGLDDKGELFVARVVYSYEIEATVTLGNSQRRILMPPEWDGVVTRQLEKWIISIDTRAFSSGATLTPMGEKYLQQIMNLIKEKSAYTKGEYREAIQILGGILEKDPDNTEAKTYAGEPTSIILSKAKRYEESGRLRKALTTAIKLRVDEMSHKINAKVSRYLSSGIVAFNKRNYTEARRQFKKVLVLDSKNRKANYYLRRISASKERAYNLYLKGIFAYAEERYETAISYWQEALRLDPGIKNAKKNIRRAKKKLKYLKE